MNAPPPLNRARSYRQKQQKRSRERATNHQEKKLQRTEQTNLQSAHDAAVQARWDDEQGHNSSMDCGYDDFRRSEIPLERDPDGGWMGGGEQGGGAWAAGETIPHRNTCTHPCTHTPTTHHAHHFTIPTYLSLAAYPPIWRTGAGPGQG